MPVYRFRWFNIPQGLIQSLSSGLGLEGDPLEALKDRYGSRPKPEFIRDTWSILLEQWLSVDSASAKLIASILRVKGLGDPLTQDNLAYLRTCRNSSSLRSAVLKIFISFGESGLASSEQDEVDEPKTGDHRLVGEELLAKIIELGEVRDVELLRAAGYLTYAQDGSEVLHEDDFFKALHDAIGYSDNEVSEGGESARSGAMTCVNALELLCHQVPSSDEEVQSDDGIELEQLLGKVIEQEWASQEEYALFFAKISIHVYESLSERDDEDEGGVVLFDREIAYSFYPGTAIWNLWTKARRFYDVVEKFAGEQNCLTDEMEAVSIFDIIPRALAVTYGYQSLSEWLAKGYVDEDFSHQDNEFFCTLIGQIEEGHPALRDIVGNLRSSPVLDELVFCKPEFIITDQLLLEGYGSNGLLQNGSLTSNALTYLGGLLLDIPLPPDYSATTEGDLGALTVGENDISYFRKEYEESLSELDLTSIVEAIGAHPNCSQSLIEQLAKQ